MEQVERENARDLQQDTILEDVKINKKSSGRHKGLDDLEKLP